MMIEEVIAAVVSKTRLSAGGNLDGFVTDADYAFEADATFEDVQIARTSRADCLLEISARAPARMTTLQHISRALKEAWQSLAYSDLQATSIVWYRQATVMRFVTANVEGTLCVTGRVTVTGPQYPRMVADFERDFAFVGPLPDVPSM